MSVRLKYVMLPTPVGDWPVLFPENIQHRQAVDRLTVKPVSAGFCAVKRGVVTVFGESASLDLPSRPQDAAIIRDTLKLTELL
ncbi:MAG: hypothetical protein KGL39_47760 [Patescibacteria group bacterium]|nr:hypothetical protein [Patescibacteria group bacterium]